MAGFFIGFIIMPLLIASSISACFSSGVIFVFLPSVSGSGMYVELDAAFDFLLLRYY